MARCILYALRSVEDPDFCFGPLPLSHSLPVFSLESVPVLVSVPPLRLMQLPQCRTPRLVFVDPRPRSRSCSTPPLLSYPYFGSGGLTVSFQSPNGRAPGRVGLSHILRRIIFVWVVE